MVDKVIEYIDAHRESYVERLKELLRIESISTDPAHEAQMTLAAEQVRGLLAEAGMEAALIKTARHPAVLCDSGGDGSGPSVLVYGHYDVQPTGDASLWDSDPFEPTVRDGKLYARGSADDKGQVLVHLLAAEAWMKVAGHLPVRAKYLIEGEEEIGSPNLETVIREHRDALACDYVVLSDTGKFDENTPAITYGTKGLVYKQITVFGPKQDLHSGAFGGTVANPGNVLAEVLASLKDADGRITIPGFYDDVQDLGEAEKSKLLALPFNEAGYQEAIGVSALIGEAGYSTIERKWVRPTLDVNGLYGGFTGDGAATIIPSKMSAKVSMRLVPDQDDRKVSAAFDEAVRSATPPGVRVEIETFGCCGPYVCPLDNPAMSAAAAAVEAGYGTAPVFIREGGSLPILPMFKEVLGAESIMMGFADPNCNLHGPNEFFGLEDFHKGIRSAAHLLAKLATM